MLLSPMEKYASLVCLTNDLHGISEAASHETEVNIVELRIWVDPFVFGIVDNEAQIRRDAVNGLAFCSTRDGSALTRMVGQDSNRCRGPREVSENPGSNTTMHRT